MTPPLSASFGDEGELIQRREPDEAQLRATAERAEMAALSAIVEAFRTLPVEARARTLRYLNDRYGEVPGKATRAPAAPRPSETRD